MRGAGEIGEHRVAITNSRLVALGDDGLTPGFNPGDYRADGVERHKSMTLAAHELIRRFLIHVPPSGFHRIRHHGLFANGGRAANLARARRLLAMPAPMTEPEEIHAVEAGEPPSLNLPGPCRRWRYDHHRDLRARRPAPRTAIHAEPDQRITTPIMTPRHFDRRRSSSTGEGSRLPRIGSPHRPVDHSTVRPVSTPRRVAPNHS